MFRNKTVQKISANEQALLDMSLKYVCDVEVSADLVKFNVLIPLSMKYQAGGCGLTLIESNNIILTDPVILEKAKKSNTPILIKQDERLFMYGDKNENNQWGFTEITNTDSLPPNLFYNAPTTLTRDNSLFSTQLIDKLKTGHAQISDIPRSYRVYPVSMPATKNLIQDMKEQLLDPDYNKTLYIKNLPVKSQYHFY